MDLNTSKKKRTSRNCCCAYGCSNSPYNSPDLAFHTFPKDIDRHQKWVRAVNRKNWVPSNSTILCSAHFERYAYQRPPGLRCKPLLKKDAVPTRFETYPDILQPSAVKRRRTLVRTLPETSTTFVDDNNSAANTSPPPEQPSTSQVQTPPQSKCRGRPKLAADTRIRNLKRKINTLTQRVQRLKKKARIQKNLLDILQKENKIQHAKLGSIDECLSELITNQIANKRRSKQARYSQQIKEFALTMHYYSPRAYAYLRSVLNLPNARTIRSWLETIDCKPGFLVDVIKSINARGESDRNFFSLVIDSMSIRKRLTVEKSTGKIEGYVTVGDKTKLAAEALVFLLVPLLGGVRHPIGYFLIDKIDSDMQSQLIIQCLKLTAEHNIKVLNITCDGCAANLTTLKKLGAKLPEEPSFKHPTLHLQVFVTLDPVHMLKLARNAFGTVRTILSVDGVINYSYIEKLVELQDRIGLRLANKLSKKHINWQNVKMKVRLAAEMLSSSVADALEYLKSTDLHFRDAGPTITFIRQIDRLFDILNTHSPYGKGYKSPLSRSNLENTQQTLSSTIEYLDQLTLSDGRPVNTSRRKTFILGFRIAAVSFIGIGKHIFDTIPESKYLLSYKIGQDHIETLFSRIRSKGGFNNNPDVVSFQSALKGLLVKSDITPSPCANCVDMSTERNESICSFRLVPKSRKKSVLPESTHADDDGDGDVLDEVSDLDMDLTKPILDIVEYITGYVLRSLKLTCNECAGFVTTVCITIPTSSDYLSLINIKNRGGLITPSSLVNRICIAAEKTLRMLLVEGLSSNIYQLAITKTLTTVYLNNLHSGFSSCHSTSLIRTLVARYCLIRLRYETTKIQSAENLRQKLSRLVVFSHI